MSQIYPQDNSQDPSVQRAIVDAKFCSETPTVLTVWKKSLVFGGEGFTVYDSNGDLVFRVDCYSSGRLYDEIVLMDAEGKALLTLRKKLPSLHCRWEGFLGDRTDGKKPIFTVRKSSILPTSSVDVFFVNSGLSRRPIADYHIEGSLSGNACTISTSSSVRKTAAEIKRKCGVPGVVLKDVFSLSVEPGFDKAFIMGIIVILDHISRNKGDPKRAADNDKEKLVKAAHSGG
eukprot:TRINITY_DN3984_c0_g1_i2.p1 TRINITY_DN3984_c0_g1~~TRINITY_DN3984_c0_g1_i2.p1  ORF type:complete len:231 (+),score=21.43 TRINITY_DN3984_c0_g1_i2:263-955(+)